MLERRCKNASAARLHLLSCHFHIPFDSGGTFFNRRGLDGSVHIHARMGRYHDGEEEDLDLEEDRLCFSC